MKAAASRSSLQLKGYVALLLLTFLWGSTFPFIKIVVVALGFAYYVALRHLIAVLALAPAAVAARRKLRWSLAPGAVLGALYFGGITLQGWGMELTTASNAAFITSLSVVMVYVLEAARGRARLNLNLTASVALSVAGVYLLSCYGAGLAMNLGDLIVLVGALFWALQIMAVSTYTVKYDFLSLLFLEVFFTMLGGWLLVAPLKPPSPGALSAALIPLLYLALICTLATNALQLYGQKYVASVNAAVTYTLEPVFAALLSALIIGEALTLPQMLGAAFIVSAVTLSARALPSQP